jgi:hypothetical protein
LNELAQLLGTPILIRPASHDDRVDNLLIEQGFPIGEFSGATHEGGQSADGFRVGTVEFTNSG